MKTKSTLLIILINLSLLVYGKVDTLSKNETSTSNTNEVEEKVFHLIINN
jgi:hypothetical protein